MTNVAGAMSGGAAKTIQEVNDSTMETHLYDIFRYATNFTTTNQNKSLENVPVVDDMTNWGDPTSTANPRWLLTKPIASLRYNSYGLLVFVAMLFVVFTIWTIAGNIIVWVSLYKYKNLQTMSNILIGNLALSDFLLALTVMPISIGHDLIGYWIYGKLMCTVWLCIDVLYCTASIWGLCTIAVDRYTATIYPVWYHEQRSPKRAMIYIIFIWLFSIIVSFAPFIGWRDMIPSFYQYDSFTETYDCVLFMNQSYVVYSAFGSFFIPFCLMVFLYIRIFIVLHQRSVQHKKKAQLHKLLRANIHKQDNSNNASIQGLNRESIELTTVVTKESLSATTSSGQNEDGMSVSKGVYAVCTETDDIKSDEDTSMTWKGYSSGVGYTSDNELLPKNKTCINTTLTSDATTESDHEYFIVTNKNFRLKTTDSEGGSDMEVGADLRMKMVHGYRKIPVRKSLSLDPQSGKGRRSVSLTLNELPSSKQFRLGGKATENGNNSHKAEVRGRKNRLLSVPFIRPGKIGRNQMTASMKRRYELREQRATKRMALIMACFVVCWMPFFLMYIIRSLCKDCYVNIHVQGAVIWLGYINSGLNPILYTIFNDDFRKAFKRLLGIKSKGHSVR